MNPKLIIFDVDGTLVERDTDVFLPGVEAWFKEHGDSFMFALASNQGGVGLRHWMETNGFGDPSKYPDQHTAARRIGAVAAKLGRHVPVYVCFAYQSQKSGQWAPVPEGVLPSDVRWHKDYRKPAPGMLLAAMREAGVGSAETLMVGDFQSDLQAAIAARCHFQWAHEFFGRPQA